MMLGSSGFAEEQLATYLLNLESNPLGWQAVHLHFSRLNPHHRRDSTIRIALNGLHDLVRQHTGKIFLLFNYDVVAFVKGALVSEVNEAVEVVRALFQDDPLSRRPESFSTWYDLSVGIRKLQREARELAIEKARQRDGKRSSETGFVDIQPLDPARLYKLQLAVGSLDLSTYVRRQPVCAMAGDSHPRPVFEELYVRIADLQKPLLPSVNLSGNRWLFQHLTQSLDLRILSLLTRDPDSWLTGPVSLNMNVDTILSQAFLGFDQGLKSGAQRQVVIEVQPIDVFADYKAFQFAREFLRSKGYRLCMDGVTLETLPLLRREQLGVDLLKLHWDPAIARNGEASDNDAHAAALAALKASDPRRLIVSRCDDEAAVEFGQSLGIALFQGRYVDEILKPGSYNRN